MRAVCVGACVCMFHEQWYWHSTLSFVTHEMTRISIFIPLSCLFPGTTILTISSPGLPPTTQIPFAFGIRIKILVNMQGLINIKTVEWISNMQMLGKIFFLDSSTSISAEEWFLLIFKLSFCCFSKVSFLPLAEVKLEMLPVPKAIWDGVKETNDSQLCGLRFTFCPLFTWGLGSGGTFLSFHSCNKCVWSAITIRGSANVSSSSVNQFNVTLRVW